MTDIVSLFILADMTIAPLYPSTFVPLSLPGARSDERGVLPFVLRYTGEASLDFAKEQISQLAIDRLLAAGRGALLVRGLPVESPAEISEAVRAFGVGKEYRQVGIAGTRTYVGEELQTANEGPPTLRFFQHNEWARFPKFPSKIFFACHTFSPQEGGETPLTNSVEVYERLNAEFPDVISELAQKGLVSQQYYPPPGLEGSDNAFNWRQPTAFGESIQHSDSEEVARQKAEQTAQYHTGSKVSWTEEGGLIISMTVPALRRVPTGATFFNGLTGRFGMIQQRGALEPPHVGKDGMKYILPTYGDGTPIPRDFVTRMLEIQDEITVKVPWKQGDIVLLDNHIVQHGRLPWIGLPEDRIIFTSLRDDGETMGVY